MAKKEEEKELVPGDAKRTTARSGGSVTIDPSGKIQSPKNKPKPDKEADGGDR